MCGIIGFSFRNEELVSKGIKSIEHRGPDAFNSYLDDNISLGHSLLSIRGEVKNSVQPFKKPNSDWLLAFNGQIYNLEYIKKLLSSDLSNENLDTKILYELINIYGWNFVDHIEGMYSIFLMNIKTEEMRLYRDSSGQKPIYYSKVGQDIFFSSEIKGLISLGIKKDVDFESVSFFLHLGYLPGSNTIFKNIKRLLPGEYLIFNKKKKIFKQKEINESCSTNFFLENISDDLNKLVDLHLQSKTKVCMNLSGGMDSSSLLWASKNSDKNISALTTKFSNAPNEYNEEVKLAEKLCKSLDVEHDVIEITKKDFISNFIEAYQTVEEPNGNVAIPLYFLTAKYHKANNNTVVISGDGGDETWGGYNHHLDSKKLDLNKFYFLKKMATQNFFKRRIFFNLTNPIERYLYLRSSSSNMCRNDLKALTEYLKKHLASLLCGDEIRNLSVTQQMFSFERLSWLAEENFMRSDKLYMSQSIEVRSPFAFESFRKAFNNKFELKKLWQNGLNKYPLRNSLNGKLIDEINWRKEKVGWKAPLQEKWYDSEFKSLLLDIIPNKNTDIISWNKLRKSIEMTDKYPGKLINYFASLAIISNHHSLDL